MAIEVPEVKSAGRSEDTDSLEKQLATVREDIVKLTAKVAEVAELRARALTGDIAYNIDHAASVAVQKGRYARAQLEDAVHANPITAVVMAACAGYIFGSLSRR